MPAKPVKRRCLKCDKPFWSKGTGNRLCWECNRDNLLIRQPDVYPAPKEKP